MPPPKTALSRYPSLLNSLEDYIKDSYMLRNINIFNHTYTVGLRNMSGENKTGNAGHLEQNFVIFSWTDFKHTNRIK